jgi:hypothetical protein
MEATKKEQQMTHPHTFIRQYLALENKKPSLKKHAQFVDFCNFNFIHVFRAHGGNGSIYRDSMKKATNEYLSALNKKAALFNSIFGH